MTSIWRPIMAMLAATQTSEKSRRRKDWKVSVARAPINVAKNSLLQTGADYNTGRRVCRELTGLPGADRVSDAVGRVARPES